jgi:inosine triphosphate pyrophosphatase
MEMVSFLTSFVKLTCKRVGEKPADPGSNPGALTFFKMKLYFVTGNKNKLEEARKLLPNADIEQMILELPELQGEPEEIALEKARLACEKTGKTVFVEDTCLVFNAWKGLPGPYIKDFVQKIGVENFPRLLACYDDKSAFGICTIGFCSPGKKPLLFQGKVKGMIVSLRGEKRFDWDRVFMPDGYGITFSEMTLSEKNKISHRKLAFDEFRKFLLRIKKEKV